MWTKIDKLLGVKKQWAVKHYRNVFRKASYSGNFDTNAKEIALRVIESNPLQKKSIIVADVKERLCELDIFPGTIESFVYQQINKKKNSVIVGIERDTIGKHVRFVR